MSKAAKILWSEGLFLQPQHFQAQEQYFEQRQVDVLRLCSPYAYGLITLEVDEDALASGLLRLTKIEALLSDGELVTAPDPDALPSPVQLGTIEGLETGRTFYLGLPLMRPAESNFTGEGRPGNGPRRYLQREHDAHDLYTDAIVCRIATLSRHLRLFSEHDSMDGHVSLPLLRLRRNASGGFELDHDFVPPCLSLEASPVLMQLLRRMLEILQAKAAALHGYHREPSQHLVEFRSGDIASFWLLHTVNAAHADLSHLFRLSRLPPERLFQALLRLAGALLTFSKRYGLSDLPSFDPANLGASFTGLETIIRDLLETVISTHHVSIALNEQRPSYFSGRLDSDKLSERSAYYLSVAADLPPAELVEAVPARLKIGSPDDVENLVLSALPGVRLLPQPQVPAAIPVRPGCYYFSLEARGSLYERMLQARTVCVYAPTVFKDLKLELYAVTP